MHPALHKNIDGYINGAFVSTAALTAGGSGDNAEAAGQEIDVAAYDSASIQIAFEATLGQDETLTINNVTIEEGDVSGALGAAEQLATGIVLATGPSGGGTVRGVRQIALPLRMRAQFIEIDHTPDLSAANTDTAVVTVSLVLGGAKVIPE